MDLRVRRTRALLWDALLALLAERPFGALTVDEICARAMVNRTTFYKHYRDKHDLAVRGAEAMLAGLAARLDDPPARTVRQAARGTPPAHITALFRHVAAEPAFFRLAFSDDTALPFRAVLERLLVERTRRRVAAAGREGRGPVPDELVAVYSAGALTAALAWWVGADLPIAPDDMAAHVGRLTADGAYAAAGLA